MKRREYTIRGFDGHVCTTNAENGHHMCVTSTSFSLLPADNAVYSLQKAFLGRSAVHGEGRGGGGAKKSVHDRHERALHSDAFFEALNTPWKLSNKEGEHKPARERM